MTFRGTFEWALFIPFLLFSMILFWMIAKNVLVFTRFLKTEGVVGGKTAGNTTELGRTWTYTTDVVFTTKDGQEHTVASTVRSSKARHAVGERVPVYYPPQNPADARLGTFFDLWLGVLGVGFFWFLSFILWFGALVGSPV